MINKISQLEVDRTACQEIISKAESIKDDFFDYSKVVVRKPWGYEYLLYENDSIAAWILYLKENAQTSMHCHPNKKTSLVVLQGEVVCSSLASETPRSAGQGMVIDKGVFHQTTAKSTGGAFVIEIESPVNKRDLLRLKDKYGREQQGYENSDNYSNNVQNYNYLSFIESDVVCNQKKRFGKCSLNLKRVENTQQLKDLFNLNEDDIICNLRGTIFNSEKSEVVLGPADSASILELRSQMPLQINHPVEVLVIKKMDNVIKVSDYVVSFLRKSNFFFVPGDANVHFLDSLGRTEGAQFISFFTERAASFAAEACAKTSGKPAVMIVSSGGSGPAAISGVANAWVDSTPMIIISGQARSDQDFYSGIRQLGNKSLNIIDVVKPITKYAVKINDPTTIKYHLEKAYYLSTSGRPGPVWLDIPIDLQGATIDESELVGFTPELDIDTKEPSSDLQDQIIKIIELLKAAQRPVLLLGQGAKNTCTKDKILNWIDKLGIPVLLTRRGSDLLAEDHPLFFGRPGAYGQRRANFIIQNSDLLISVGARLSIPFVGKNHKSFARKAKKIVVDIDQNELKKTTVAIDMPIQSTAGVFIEAFLSQLTETKLNNDIEDWKQRCNNWLIDFPVLKEYAKNRDAVNPYIFTSKLSKLIPDEALIVLDGGAVTNFVMQTFEFKKNQKLILSTGLELPGFALSGSIGVSLAAHKSMIICLCEDVGIQAALSDLQTLMNEKLPVKFFVFKSNGNLAIRNIQKDFFGSRYVGTDFLSSNSRTSSLGKIAQALGCKCFEITDDEQIQMTVQDALSSKETSFCEISIDVNQEIIPRPGFVVKEDGKWLAKPIEDMFPLLDKQILKSNMLIDLAAED